MELRVKADRKIIYVSILAVALIRGIDAFTDALYFTEGSGSGALSRAVFHEVFDASVVLAIVLGCAILVSRAIAKRQAAECELSNANDELERRSGELQGSNERLEAELSEHRKTAKALQESESRVQSLSFQILAAQEKERREISMVLHDEFGQGLASLKQHLWRIQKRLKPEESELADEVKESLKIAGEAIENVRRISSDLSPHVLEYCGASMALRKLIGDFSKRYDISVRTELTDIDHQIPRESKIVVYRIFQEALNNIGKHASATHLRVLMKNGGNRLSFLIEDNGRGFDVNTTTLRDGRGKGLGLAILDERVKLLGGQWDIWSQEGKGTRVSFHIPASCPPVE